MSANRRALAVGVAAFALAGGVALAGRGEWDSARWFAQATGWAAALCLLGTIAMTPLGSRGARWRRPLGITSALLATAHFALAFGGPLQAAWTPLWTWPYLRAGLLALALLLALLTTSFSTVLKRFRVKHWKTLHRLSYAVAILVVQHLFGTPAASRVWVLVFLAALVVLLVARGVRWVFRRRRAAQ
ncbi:MAG: ferric reductase-like transmembrane domain-containing protein [Myxococcota bacterium]